MFFIAMLLLGYFHHHDIIRCLKFEAWSREQDRAATGTWNQSLKSDDASLTVMAVLDIKADGCTVNIISALSALATQPDTLAQLIFYVLPLPAQCRAKSL